MARMTVEERRARARERYHRIRAQVLAEMGGKCTNCGDTDRLDVHHVDPKKKKTHLLAGLSEKDRRREMKKCVLLCRYCHSRYTAISNGQRPDLSFAQLRNHARWRATMSDSRPTGIPALAENAPTL